jgi:hypothetical protein
VGELAEITISWCHTIAIFLRAGGMPDAELPRRLIHRMLIELQLSVAYMMASKFVVAHPKSP